MSRYLTLEDFLVGMPAISAIGTPGKVTRLLSEEKREDRHDSIDISWDNGAYSNMFLLWETDGWRIIDGVWHLHYIRRCQACRE